MTLVVSGYYGFANAGDEAVLSGMLRSFADAGVDRSRFVVLSADPGATEREHGVRAVPRMHMAGVRQAIRDADAVLSGGGSLFQDSTSLRSVVYYAAMLRMAYRASKPVAIYAQGIGPLRRRVSRWLVRRVIRPARHVSVRDPQSRDLLRAIGVVRDDIEVTCDPAFALDAGDETKGRSLLGEAGLAPDRPVVGLAPRPWPSAQVSTLVAGVAERLKAMGYGVVTLPMQPALDRPLCESTGLPMVVPSLNGGRLTGGFLTYINVCAALNVVVGMRLHALIFGAIAGTSLVGLAYDPKVAAFMETLSLSKYVTVLNETSPGDIADAVARAAEDSDARSRLREAAERMRTEAATHARRVVRKLGGDE